jgi:hypothetical protein
MEKKGVNLPPLSRQKIGLFMVHNQATSYNESQRIKLVCEIHLFW